MEWYGEAGLGGFAFGFLMVAGSRVIIKKFAIDSPFFSHFWDSIPWRLVHMALAKIPADVAKRLIEQEPDLANGR